SPAANTTNLSSQERVAYALLEGIMQSVEAKVHSTGCTPVVLPLSVYSDAFASPVQGSASIGVAPNSLVLFAKAQTTPGYRGQAIDVRQQDFDPITPPQGAGYINGTEVTGYKATHTFNSANNMMVGWMEVNAMSINWEPNQFTGKVIKDFYTTNVKAGDYHIIYDWGLQSLSKWDKKKKKYWQRSKSRRSDGGNGQTAFVKDRLVGVVPCRIAIALSGLNQIGVFQQTGVLTISTLKPSESAPATAGDPVEITDVLDI
ncbi:MAG: hypothetical protein KDI74_07370, partial [Gammaproteobacteria bacterium]|nr:hypothetical protein [Gammaproteobacteria bacterium]